MVWTCPECASRNDVAQTECTVCGYTPSPDAAVSLDKTPAESPVQYSIPSIPVSFPVAPDPQYQPDHQYQPDLDLQYQPDPRYQPDQRHEADQQHQINLSYYGNPSYYGGRDYGGGPDYGGSPERYAPPAYHPQAGFADNAQPGPGVLTGPAGRSDRSTPHYLRWTLIGLLAIVLALLVGIKAVPALTRGTPTTADAGRNTGTVDPTPTSASGRQPSSTPTRLSSIGVVNIDAAAATDPRTRAVAAMFNTYFTAVNNRNAEVALSVYDPAGAINPSDPDQVSYFTRAIATTSESDIALRRIGPDPTGKGALSAEVTFRSRQSPGYGPNPNPNETCTVWDVTYTLTAPNADTYRILAGSATHTPC